jgi:hypothetical protein
LLQSLLLAGCCAGVFCLSSGVFITIGALERALLLPACLGAELLLGGALLVEFSVRFEAGSGGNGNRGPAAGPARGRTAIEVVVLQALVLLPFASVMDGGVRLQACWYSYLGYLAGALLILARRGRAPTRGDLLYLRWAWLPIVVIGVVLFLRVWKAKGLL